MNTQPLANIRIFYLEDDFYIAEDTRERLEKAGADVVLCGSVRRALGMLDTDEFDVALLDINVSGTSSVPVARIFAEAGVPVLFLTGYARDILPADLAACALLTKPVDWPAVVRGVQDLLGRTAPEPALRPRLSQL